MSRRRETAKVRDFRARYGPAALVTGAAQGIGRAFADALASRGLGVFLLDLQEEEVRRAAAEVAADCDVPTWPIVADLSQRDFMRDVEATLTATDTDVGLVVCNAAIGLEGPYLEESIENLQRAVDVNCQAAIRLSHHFGKEMAARRRGGLVLIASGTALQGSPGYANYAATKAFNLVLGESLWYEFAENDVDVLSFVPGPTNTPGMRKSLPHLEEGVEVGPIRLPSVTAESAVEALGKRASAAREKAHANRLAARRRAADEILERQRSNQRRAEARSRRGSPSGAPGSK